jgi:3-oxoacyl-[acyl-carrier-protein] synthase-3
LALDEALDQKKIKKGDYLVLVAVGAGTTYASALVRW